MKIGLLGRKIGMTRVYDASGKATPVTVIDAGGNTILQIKSQKQDGYDAVQIGFDSQKESRVSKPLLGHFKKANADPKKFVREFRLPDGTQVDADLNLSVSQFAVRRVCRRDRPLKGQGLSRCREKARVCRPTSRSRVQDPSSEWSRRKPVYSRPYLEKYGDARSYG